MTPNAPRPDNPGRVVRIEDGLWSAAQALAERQGVPVSQVVRDALTQYVDNHTRENHGTEG